MSADPSFDRIEAAATAFYGPAFDDLVFAEAEHAQQQIKDALAAADAVMFSEEAIERAARRMVADDYGPNWEGCVPAWVLPGYIAKVNAVVAALRGGEA